MAPKPQSKSSAPSKPAEKTASKPAPAKTTPKPVAKAPAKPNPQTPGTKYRDRDGTIRTYNAPATQKNAKQIIESMPGSGFTQFIGNDTVGGLTLEGLVNAITKQTPPPEAFETVSASDFRSQAEGEASAFFDKDLELALRELEKTRADARAQKEFAERFQKQEEEQYFRVEDRGFARALGRAQSGFAGRGTFTSGFRNEAINQQGIDRGENLQEAQRGFQKLTEGRNMGFEQFLEGSKLLEERTRLEIERARESEILGRQSQIASQINAQRSNVIDMFDRDFNRTIGFANFLNQKSSA